MTMAYRLGVDIGGTFTDFAVVDEASGAIRVEKMLTSAKAPEETVLASAPEALPKALRETIGTLEDLRRFLLEGDLAAIGALMGETRQWAEEE